MWLSPATMDVGSLHVGVPEIDVQLLAVQDTAHAPQLSGDVRAASQVDLSASQSAKPSAHV